MNLLVWHVHGSWMTAFVQGTHTYLTPVVPGRGPEGLGRARTWDWPASVAELPPDELAETPIDVVVAQRPLDLELAARWLGPRFDQLPLIYVEHDTPLDLRCPRHHVADRPGTTLVHVTTFNALMWQSGSTPVRVVEHGVVDPGLRYRGDIEAAVAAVNEPVRRRWVAGTDLLEQVRTQVPVDLFGMQAQELGGVEVDQAVLHDEMARRRAYLHPFRWTSLGLTLVEAMHLGLPVVALAATEVPHRIPPEAGVLAGDAATLTAGVRRFLDDPADAAATGRVAREVALQRFGLGRFLADWDDLLADVVSPAGRRSPRAPFERPRARQAAPPRG